MLTRSLVAHQVFALGLVGVDGRDGDRVLRVRVQVLKNVRRLVAVQDGLRTEGEREEEEGGFYDVIGGWTYGYVLYPESLGG